MGNPDYNDDLAALQEADKDIQNENRRQLAEKELTPQEYERRQRQWSEYYRSAVNKITSKND